MQEVAIERDKGVYHLHSVLKHDTAVGLGRFKIIEGAERGIGDALDGQGPYAFTRVPFGKAARSVTQGPRVLLVIR